MLSDQEIVDLRIEIFIVVLHYFRFQCVLKRLTSRKSFVVFSWSSRHILKMFVLTRCLSIVKSVFLVIHCIECFNLFTGSSSKIFVLFRCSSTESLPEFPCDRAIDGNSNSVWMPGKNRQIFSPSFRTNDYGFFRLERSPHLLTNSFPTNT